MYRLALFVALVAAAFTAGCGSLDDDRPATLPYIQAAIFEPTCAKAQCHSSFAQEDGDDFGSFTETEISIVANGLIIPDDLTATDSFIVGVLTHGEESFQDPGTYVRMPYDEPMPAEDIKLIERWISTPNALGLGAEGAQCVPNAQGVGCTLATTTSEGPVPCSPEGNVLSLTPTTTCSNSEVCNVRTGTCVNVAQ